MREVGGVEPLGLEPRDELGDAERVALGRSSRRLRLAQVVAVRRRQVEAVDLPQLLDRLARLLAGDDLALQRVQRALCCSVHGADDPAAGEHLA